MSLTDREAMAHPAYNDSLFIATRGAAGGVTHSIYWDGTLLYVRESSAAVPAGALCICVAEKWDDKTVQLRFAGARSEWIKI